MLSLYSQFHLQCSKRDLESERCIHERSCSVYITGFISLISRTENSTPIWLACLGPLDGYQNDSGRQLSKERRQRKTRILTTSDIGIKFIPSVSTSCQLDSQRWLAHLTRLSCFLWTKFVWVHLKGMPMGMASSDGGRYLCEIHWSWFLLSISVTKTQLSSVGIHVWLGPFRFSCTDDNENWTHQKGTPTEKAREDRKRCHPPLNELFEITHTQCGTRKVFVLCRSFCIFSLRDVQLNILYKQRVILHLITKWPTGYMTPDGCGNGITCGWSRRALRWPCSACAVWRIPGAPSRGRCYRTPAAPAEREYPARSTPTTTPAKNTMMMFVTCWAAFWMSVFRRSSFRTEWEKDKRVIYMQRPLPQDLAKRFI